MEGFNNFQRSVQDFGNQTSSLNDYISNFDSQFYSNWRDKVGVGQRQIDEAQKVLSGAGDAYVASKLIGQTAKKIGARIAGDDSQEIEAPEGLSAEGYTDEDVEDLFPSETGTPLSTEASLARPTTLQQSTVEEELPEEVEMTDMASAFKAPVEPSEDTGGLSSTATQDAILDTDPEEVAGLGGTISDVVNTSNVADESGTALDGALNTVGDVIDGAVDVASTALDFLGPVGLLAGLGVSLYEALDPHKRPSAPNAVTANSKSELVVPSFDSVVDTPASNSAF